VAKVGAIPLLPPERALQWLAQRRPVPKDLLGTLLKDNAFTVAYLASVEQVQRVLESLARAIKDGQTIAAWRAGLSDLDLTAPHLNTVYRNAVFGSLNAGRYAEFMEDIEDYPWAFYQTAGDDHVRENHAANDGLAMPIADPRWQGRTPMLGHMCRCLLVNFTEEEARARARILAPEPNSLADSAGWGLAFYRAPAKTLRSELPVAERPPESFMGQAMQLTNLPDITDVLRAEGRATVRSKQSVLPGDAEYLKALPAYDKAVLNYYAANGDYYAIRKLLAAGEELTAVQRAYLAALRGVVTANEKVWPGAKAVTTARVAPWPRYSMPAYYTRTVDFSADPKFGRALQDLVAGTRFKLSGAASFNANGAVYGASAAELELVVVNAAAVLPVAPLSAKFSAATEQEVLMWGGVFRVVRVADERFGDSARTLRRVYVERVADTAADVTLAARGLGAPMGTALPNGTDIDAYIDAVLLNVH
jgi:hypothetical protein